MWGGVDLGGVRGKAGLEYGQITLYNILKELMKILLKVV